MSIVTGNHLICGLLSLTNIDSFDFLHLLQQIATTTDTNTHMSRATPPKAKIPKITEVDSTTELLASVVVVVLTVCDNKTCLLSITSNKCCFAFFTFAFLRCAKYAYILTVLAVMISWSVMSAI